MNIIVTSGHDSVVDHYTMFKAFEPTKSYFVVAYQLAGYTSSEPHMTVTKVCIVTVAGYTCNHNYSHVYHTHPAPQKHTWFHTELRVTANTAYQLVAMIGRWGFYTPVLSFYAAATAVLFIITHSHAALTAADIDVSILPHPYYQGQVEQDPVPDPGIGDWFANIYNVIVKVIAKGL